MPEPRYRRRKQDRPQEITAAAFEAFDEQGYAATRVDDVARRAGVSKGLMYLYFRTKEELFKAVVKSVVLPKIDTLFEFVKQSEHSPGELIRGPILKFMQNIPGSKISVVIRLLLSEGHRHPDLLDFYWENVVSRGLSTMTELIDRGVARGEFRKTAVSEMPQMILQPVILSVVWNMLFEKRSLDTDRFIATHVDMLLNYIEVK